MRTLPQEITKASQLLLRASRKLVLRPGEALLLCRMAWWICVVSISARCLALPRALQVVAARRAGRLVNPNIQQRLGTAVDLVLSADVLMFKPNCWKRAAVLHRFLALNGIQTRIVFGVRSDAEGKVSGHAWLESNGKPILESVPPNYVVTYTYPSAESLDSVAETDRTFVSVGCGDP
jgi:hypothetical protein